MNPILPTSYAPSTFECGASHSVRDGVIATANLVEGGQLIFISSTNTSTALAADVPTAQKEQLFLPLMTR